MEESTIERIANEHSLSSEKSIIYLDSIAWQLEEVKATAKDAEKYIRDIAKIAAEYSNAERVLQYIDKSLEQARNGGAHFFSSAVKKGIEQLVTWIESPEQELTNLPYTALEKKVNEFLLGKKEEGMNLHKKYSSGNVGISVFRGTSWFHDNSFDDSVKAMENAENIKY